VATLCVEPAKFLIRRANTLLYVALIAYQFILGVDVLRGNAMDWWVWILSVMGLTSLGTGDWRNLTFPIASPWISLIGAITICAALVTPRRERSPDGV
jgi:hypothetical protein